MQIVWPYVMLSVRCLSIRSEGDIAGSDCAFSCWQATQAAVKLPTIRVSFCARPAQSAVRRPATFSASGLSTQTWTPANSSSSLTT